MFRALPVNIQTQLMRARKNLGRPNTEQFGRALHDMDVLRPYSKQSVT